MLQAAARGVIDFTSIRLHDPRWWQRTRILLRQLDEDNTVDYLRTIHHHNVSTLVVPNLKEEVFSEAVAQAGAAVRGIKELRFPWEPRANEETATKSLRQQWADVWGDPDDPAVKQRIQETVDLLKATSVRSS